MKNPLASKTIHFNVWTMAVWPFLPKSFRHYPDAPAILAAWFSIGNILLRFLTSEALDLWNRNNKPKGGTP